MEKVTGVAYWASLNKPNTRFNEDGIWQIDIEVDKKTQKKLTTMGLKLIEKADGRVIFRPKRNCKGKKGPNSPPIVVDNFGNDVALEVGNGSEVEVAFSIFPYKKISGVGADLAGVKIIKLVPYSRDAKDVFEFDKDTTTEEENPFE